MEKPQLKDDFYGFINHKWLENVTIPADKPAITSFSNLDERIEKVLMEDSAKWVRNKTLIPCRFPLLANYVAFYKQTMDFAKRDELGLEPVKELLKPLVMLDNFNDLSRHYHEFVWQGFRLPLVFEVGQDFKNNTINTLGINLADLILPEKGYYNDKENAEKLLQVFQDSAKKILVKLGNSELEADNLLRKTISFDQALIPYTLSAEQMANYPALYNPVAFSEIVDASGQLKINLILEKLVSEEVKEVILANKELLTGINEILNPLNFDNLKAWLYVMNAVDLARFADEESRIWAGEFRRILVGIEAPLTQEKAAFRLAESNFSQIVGLYYGHQYLGKEARKNVIEMVQKIISVYKERLSKNPWLSAPTKEKAILKLDKLALHVGYPDYIAPYYASLLVTPYEQGGNVITNIIAFREIKIKYQFALYLKTVDKNLWAMSPAMVNAYYHPLHNHIVFPAAILQKPFYDFNQTPARNFGAIGAVIAHEISHAFDNNGAKFDENGNMNNWWAEEDFKHFDELTQKMITLFDQVPTEFGSCNGKLTVSENIADCGGLQCALMAVRREEGFDPKEFFAAWATAWRFKAKPEYAKLLLQADVHAPAKLRCNIQLMNLPLFHKTFEILPKDKMFLPKEKWVRIW